MNASTLRSDATKWAEASGTVARAVVYLDFSKIYSFDTQKARHSQGTGSVVDTVMGLILTNGHVVGTGPCLGRCIFQSHEECTVVVVYVDPVHDFALVRYVPEELKFTQPQALELQPALACVGTEIRLLGNDAGEWFSILSGFISRLDRNAPDYGEGYNDFDTNYIQAAAATSGGSSGSPVINIEGFVVALHAGGRANASTSFFLPLDRVVRALHCIRHNMPITRGTIQSKLVLKPFNDCRPLGLNDDREEALRHKFPGQTSMLVVERVSPKGPADGKIQEGDLLVMVNDKLLTQFAHLDDILDSNVGSTVKLLVQRGSHDIEVDVQVGDLHAITPDRFVSVTGGLFQPFSYQRAMRKNIAIEGAGVYLLDPSFDFVTSKSGYLIEKIGNRKTPDMETFIEVMRSIPNEPRVVVKYRGLDEKSRLHTCVLTIDRWRRGMSLVSRDDKADRWKFTDLTKLLPPKSPVPQSPSFAASKI